MKYPKGIKAVYDNGGKTFDRFTIVFSGITWCQGFAVYDCVRSSANPTEPQGFYQHSTCTLGRHLGKRIAFEELPEVVKQCIREEL